MNKERWLATLWESSLVTPSGQVVDFGGNWDEWVDSIVGYSKSFAAPVLGRLPHMDVEHDEARAPVWGVVSEFRVLTQEEAAEKGIVQQAPRVLYAKVDIWDGERILYVSPKLRWNFLADDNVVWPCVISHVAVVGEPLQQTMQKPQTTLESLAMSRGSKMDKEDVDVESIDNVEDSVQDVVDTSQEAVDIVEELAARIVELEALVAELRADSEEAAVETEETELDMSRGKSALMAQIQRVVRAEVAASRKAQDTAEIKRVARTLNMSRGAAEAAHAAMSAEEWAKFSGGIPKAAAPSVPSSLGMSRAKSLTGKELDILAIAYQREHGVKYSEALSRVGGK